jgi:hypothetical protein
MTIMQEGNMRLRGLIFWVLIVLIAVPLQAQDAVVTDIVNRVNQERLAAGIPALVMNESLRTAAQRHSNDMAVSGKLAHTGTDSSEFWQRMQDAGYMLTGGAENILVSQTTDAASVFAQWDASPPHQANMLNPAYVEIGAAYTRASSGLYYFTMLVGARADVTPQPVVTMTPSPAATAAGILPTATSAEPTFTPTPAVTVSPVPATIAVVVASTMTNTPVPNVPAATPVSAGYAEISQAVRDSLYYFSMALAPEVTLPPTLTLAPVATLPVATSVPPSSADLRLVYNARSFALINVSGRKLDLKPLVFESTSGTLSASQWQIQALSEPLDAFTQNDCLQVWGLGEPFTLDKPDGCGLRHAWIVVGREGLFWQNTDGFTVKYADETVATCSTASLECDVSFASANYMPPPNRATPFMVANADIRLTISDLGVSLLNVSGRELDLSGLVFESPTGLFTAQLWNIPELTRPLTAYPPGDCLQVWGLYTQYLNPPEDCRYRHAWVSVGEQGQFWLNTDSFSVKQGETLIATCNVSADTCDIDLPNQ